MAKKRQSSSWFARRWDRCVLLVLLGILTLFVQTQTGPASLPVIAATPNVAITLPPPAPFPHNTTGLYPAEEVSASAAAVVDVDSGVVLYTRNADIELSPASTTKILTALVSLDSYALDDIVTVKTVIDEGQLMGLVSGERITVENLLYGALIHSGNDAAYALAEYYPGGVDAFVAAMNIKAKELSLDHSVFTNPIGFDDPLHKMSARDLTVLARASLMDKTIAKMVAIPQITVSDVDFTQFHALKNVNQLLGKIPGVGGIKTGWTEEAGENLVTMVERKGHRVVIVVLRSHDRFKDTSLLIDWVFTNHSWEQVHFPEQ